MENWEKVKILIAEDEIINFTLISSLLEDTGIEITHAINGEIAVQLCHVNQFNIILMDIKMPIMDGFEATTQIRKFNSDIIIIAQTAYAYKREECILAGFTDYISKPFNANELFEKIYKLL